MTLNSFPRGGQKPQKVSQKNTLFGGKLRSKSNFNKNKPIRKVDAEFNVNNLTLSRADCLTYKTLTQGMVVLGRIREIREYDFTVSLPGRLSGRVQLTDISNAYTKILQSMVDMPDGQSNGYKRLAELYKSGDYIVCYVKEFDENAKWRVILSIEPQLINQNLDPSRLVKASKVVGTVSSIEEHGYIIDTGLENLRTFLPMKEIDEGKEYFIGQQMLLVVKKLQTVDSASTATVSAKTKHNAKAVEHEAQMLDALVPGTKLFLTITKILKNGLQVSFNGDNTGYINQIYLSNQLSSYTVDTVVHGTLLYVLPTVKFAYFSLLSEESETERLNIGDVIAKAKVVCIEQNGILLRLPQKLRGFIPSRRTGVDFGKIPEIFTPASKHKCQVLNYDWLDRVYICSAQKCIKKEEHFTLDSFRPGELLDAEITRIDTEYGSISLKIGKRYAGYIAPEYVSDVGTNIIPQLKIGDSVQVRVLRVDTERNRISCTMKESLVKSDLPILSNINEAVVGSKHHGTVVQITNAGILIKFFGDTKGWVLPKMLGCRSEDARKRFTVGQVVTATIFDVKTSENKIALSLIRQKSKREINLQVGEVVEGTIREATARGIEIDLPVDEGEDPLTGFLPAGHMAPSLDLASLLSARHSVGHKISAIVFSTMPNLILTTTFEPIEQLTNFEELNVGHYLPCSIKEICQNTLKVMLPLNNYGKLATVICQTPNESQPYYLHQILLAKVINKIEAKKQLELTTDLYDIWSDEVKENADMTNAVDTLSLYLKKLHELSKHDYYTHRPISKAKIGQRITGKVEKITEHGLVLKLKSNLLGTVRTEHYNDELKVGEQVSGTIIWVNYIHEIVEITLKPTIAKNVYKNQTSLECIPTGTPLRGDIILVSNWFVLVVLKGQAKGTIVALPARRHLNDIEPDLAPYSIGGKVKCYVVLDCPESNILPICLLSSAFDTPIATMNSNSTMKRKTTTSSEENIPAKKPKIVKTSVKSVTSDDQTEDITNGTIANNRVKIQEKNDRKFSDVKNKKKSKKTEVQSETVKESDEEAVENNAENEMSIPACGFYWDVMPTTADSKQVESSSDSEEDTEGPQKKKKKLSAAERRELERQKEREIREREEALASNQIPNSVDQFDRLVMSSPDSSVVWIQYMAYHLQATEVEKARAVAQRAMKTINFREENERLNVSQAWLNLESRFGTPESLNEVFQEAIKINDAFKIYTHMLTLHAEANRQAALEKTVTTITGKFKQNPQAWADSGAALLKMGLKDKSRHVMQRALQSLPLHQHVDLMVRFAQLENRFGDKERAQTLFEQILSSYPKRVDVWSSYTDALIKSGDIPIARQVLERATAQTLPARKMKTIFKKFIAFEEQHGTPEAVVNVQQMARNYVENQCQEQH